MARRPASGRAGCSAGRDRRATDGRTRGRRCADHRRRDRDRGRRSSARWPARLHPSPFAAVARPARRDPPGPRRGRDRPGRGSSRLGRPGASHRRLPGRTRGVASPSPRQAGARTGRARRARRAAGRCHDPVPRRPPSASARAGAAGLPSLVGRADRWRRRGRDRRPRRAGRSTLDGCSARGLAQAPGPDAIDARSAATRPPSASPRPRSRIRDQRTRWGSASRQGRLAFSWRLILAPPEALETVVIHELAHLRVFGHGPRFWEVVASRRPDHKVWRRWLHDHSTELHGALDEPADPPGDRP